MLPIRDNNPTRGVAHITLTLIIINSGVFLFQMAEKDTRLDSLRYGFVPAQLLLPKDQFLSGLQETYRVPRTDPSGRPYVNMATRQYMMTTDVEAINAILEKPAGLKLLTSMFLHGGWMHLIGNMLFLWIFGKYIEDRLGPLLFILFYLVTGVGAALTHGIFDPGYVPLVGASGAISGVMGAYLVLAPKSRIYAITFIGYIFITVNLPAWIYMVFYIVIQNLYPATFSVGQGGVAHWAHLGGVVFGVALALVVPKRSALPRPAGGEEIEDADIVI
ncbi:MAG TPA: rhomboid family intramembrane serine protease [Phycisphaerae bacterium]|nr:rhomboid family intramembrane serine protease [Phycisphaerae bacterium]HRW52767.1 rhomboid family intramembrane serine protease [Phycisphaerae bacterium]